MSISQKLDIKNQSLSKHELDLDTTKLCSINDLRYSILDIIGFKPLFDRRVIRWGLYWNEILLSSDVWEKTFADGYGGGTAQHG